jgi:hypothetical protein
VVFLNNDPSLTLFEVPHFAALACEAFESIGIYHNPKRQQGIFANTAETQKTQSLAHASGWDSRKRATSKLTLRVVIKSTARLRLAVSCQSLFTVQ